MTTTTPYEAHATVVLVNGRVHTMDPRRPNAAAVAIRGSTIIAVGGESELRRYVRPGQTVVDDVAGLTVCPGFVDVHTHPRGQPSAEAFARQGVTTIAQGVDGFAIADGHGGDVAGWLTASNETGWPINQVSYIGAGQLRSAVGVKDPHGAASAAQIAATVQLARDALREGAAGVSFGTEYTPGQSYAEILALAQVAADHRAHIATHIRSATTAGPFTALDAVNEVIGAGRETGCGVHVSHIGSMASGIMRPVLQAIDEARSAGMDVTADCYPYTAWASSTKMFLEWFERYHFTYGDIEIVGGQYAGQRCTEALFSQLRSLPEEIPTIVHTIDWADVLAAMQQDYTMVASDGGIDWDRSIEDYIGHPRGAGTCPRVLATIVRDEGRLTLGQALFKMTALPAQRLCLAHKGVLAPGYDADICVFDADVVRDRADYGPGVCNTPPLGIHEVYVNGRLTVRGTEYVSEARAGRAIRVTTPS